MAETPTIQLERRRINEEIETAYIKTVQSVTNLRMYIATDKGNISQKYMDFYQWFGHLITLTIDLNQIRTKHEEVAKDAMHWLDSHDDILGEDEVVLKERARAAMTLFTSYKQALGARGIIDLPTRRG